uniref:Fn3_PAP domain-containing protein n=1 Tax=Heterorhabditis bacteriophora TaxID=37862 RepID=A0A1I7WFW1_HETBA
MPPRVFGGLHGFSWASFADVPKIPDSLVIYNINNHISFELIDGRF